MLVINAHLSPSLLKQQKKLLTSLCVATLRTWAAHMADLSGFKTHR